MANSESLAIVCCRFTVTISLAIQQKTLEFIGMNNRFLILGSLESRSGSLDVVNFAHADWIFRLCNVL